MAGTTTRIVETEEQNPLTVKTLQAAISTAMQSLESAFSGRLEKLFTLIKAQLSEIQALLSKTLQVAETTLEPSVVRGPQIYLI